MSNEENTIIFNVLKKIIEDSYSVIDICAISAYDVGIEKNCLLIKYKDKLVFLYEPKMILTNSKLKFLINNKPVFVFSKKEAFEVLYYLNNLDYLKFFSINKKEYGSREAST